MLSALIVTAVLATGQDAEPPSASPAPGGDVDQTPADDDTPSADTPTGPPTDKPAADGLSAGGPSSDDGSSDPPAVDDAPPDAPAPTTGPAPAADGLGDGDDGRPPMAVPAPKPAPAAADAPQPEPAAPPPPVATEPAPGEAGPVCEKGATNRCYCPNGDPGAQTCLEDNSGWDSCVCAGWNTFRTAPKMRLSPDQAVDNPPISHTEILPEAEVEEPPEATSDDENDVFYAAPLSLVLPGAGQLFKGDLDKGLRFFAAWAGPLVIAPPFIALSALVGVNAWLNYTSYATFATRGRTGALASEQSLRNQNAAVGAGLVAAGVIGATVAAGAVGVTVSGVAWGWSVIDAIAE